MILIFLIGVLLVAVAAALVARALAMPRVRMQTQLDDIDAYGFEAGAGQAASTIGVRRPPLGDRLNRFAERIGRSVRGSGWRAPVQSSSLRAAGVYTLSAEAFNGYRVIASILLPSSLFLLAVVSGSLGALIVFAIVLAGVLSWFGPVSLVRARARRRMDDVDRALPELIDVLSATLEAGLGFASSLQTVASRFSGALGEELRLTLQEQRMGLSTETALSHMRERCDTPSMRAFVRAVLQGESLGVSIATMLRGVAAETRKRRRQSALERIQKAPVKLLFPLVFLIFPSVLIVLLYPAVSEVLRQLGGH
jgi:tight adherence protein C